jgi:hypothetical protein
MNDGSKLAICINEAFAQVSGSSHNVDYLT